jgi:hypothetical protein
VSRINMIWFDLHLERRDRCRRAAEKVHPP